MSNELPDELREWASGPMSQNPEHTDVCNLLFRAADQIERRDRLLLQVIDNIGRSQMIANIGRMDRLDSLGVVVAAAESEVS